MIVEMHHFGAVAFPDFERRFQCLQFALFYVCAGLTPR